MGQMKDYYYSQLDRGYFDIGGKFVCSNCFNDYAIKDFIQDNVEQTSCDYCSNSSSKAIAAPIDEVLHFIMDGIYSEWGSPEDEGVAWESKEGGWQGNVLDSYDLIMDEEIIPTDNEEILKDILQSIKDNQWCQKNFYELSPEKALKYGWDEFSRIVKYSIRYVFFHKKDNLNEFRGHEEIPPYAMLEVLGKIISEVNLIKDLKKGTTIFRVRIHEPSKSFSTSKELGPPEIAKYSNRMSPAGIAMFYGAFSKKTAINETLEEGHKKPKVATIATFKTTKDMRVLDLTALPYVPSLYDQDKRNIRTGITFLYSFVRDVSKPIIKDGMEHIEYVPTQIFTEYFRHIFVDEFKNEINGILYKSSKHNGGKSCALFLENKNCANSSTNPSSDIYLILTKVKKRLLNKKNVQQ